MDKNYEVPYREELAEQILNSNQNKEAKEGLLIDLGYSFQEIREMLANFSGDWHHNGHGENVSESSKNQFSAKLTQSLLDVQASHQPQKDNHPLREPTSENLSKEEVLVHFALQYLSRVSKVDLDILYNFFSREIRIQELHEIVANGNEQNHLSLIKMLKERIPKSSGVYPFNPKLADIEPRALNKPTYSIDDSLYNSLTPCFFADKRSQQTITLLKTYQKRVATVETLFSYYEELITTHYPVIERPERFNNDTHFFKTHSPEVSNLNYSNLNQNRFDGVLLSNCDPSAKSFETLIKELRQNEDSHMMINQLTSDFEELDNAFKLTNYAIHTDKGEVDFSILASLIKTARSVFGFYPRPIQVISVLLMIRKNSDKGRLLQISTGEGKSLIIAMLAAYQAKRGKKVDIVTSSENLAIRDSQEYENFFRKLKLRVGHNILFYDKYLEEQGDNVYADCNILYGTVSEFCGNILKDFKLSKNICQRSKDFLIVDEVDNMLIDCKSYITKLNDVCDWLGVFKKVKQDIWNQLNIILVFTKAESQSSIFDKIKTEMELKEKTYDFNAYYKGIYSLCIDSWIKMAIKAKLNFIKDRNYVIKDQKVIIVDSENTGEMHSNQRWQLGLHEFIEMKEDLPVNKDGFTSYYYSNHRFFSDYKSNLCGLTGTFGSNACRAFLKNIYEVDMFEIPTFKPKLFTELPSIVSSPQGLYQTIIGQAYQVVFDKKRPVLIIVKTILEATKMITFLEGAKIPFIQYIYSDEENLHERVEQIKECVVIVATNLAGRGTDIKLHPKLEEKGGLHVILGFLPQNLRVEQQAFGRTARKGCRGDAIMIVPDNCFGVPITNIAALKSQRDKIEQKYLGEDAVKSINDFKIKDQMFEQFQTFITNLNKENQNSNQIASLTEQWGVFYLQLELNYCNEPHDLKMKKFDQFIEQIASELKNGFSSKNPLYHFKQFDKANNEGKYEEAEKYLEEAKNVIGPYESVGYECRATVLQINTGNYSNSRKSINSLHSRLRKNVNSNIQTENTARSNAILNTMSEMIQNQSESEDAQHVVSRETSNLNRDSDIAMSTISRIETVLEDNSFISSISQEFENTAKAFQNSIMLLEQAVQESEKNANPIKIKIQLDSELQQYQDSEIPTLQLPSNAKPSKKGIWGYIIGALGIVSGAVITIYCGPAWFLFGGGLIAESLSLILKNYKMNQTDTYSNELLISYFMSIGASLALSHGGFLIDKIFQSSYIADLAIKLELLSLNPETLKEILKTTLRTANIGKQFSSHKDLLVHLSKELNEYFDISKCQKYLSGANGEDGQDVLNNYLKDILKTEVQDKLNNASPEAMQKFYDDIEPYVKLKLNEVVTQSLRNSNVNLLVWAFIFMRNKELGNENALEHVIVQTKKELHHKFLIPKVEQLIFKCLQFGDFEKLKGVKINENIIGDLHKVVDQINDFHPSEISFYYAFEAFMLQKAQSNSQKRLSLEKEYKTLASQSNTSNTQNESSHYTNKDQRLAKIKAELDALKLNNDQISLCSQACQSDLFQSHVFPEISLFILNCLNFDSDWLPGRYQFEEMLGDEFRLVESYVFEFFMNSLRDKNSKICSTIPMAKTMHESLMDIFNDPVEHDLIKYVGSKV